jgi:hypothetical protein
VTPNEDQFADSADLVSYLRDKKHVEHPGSVALELAAERLAKLVQQECFPNEKKQLEELKARVRPEKPPSIFFRHGPLKGERSFPGRLHERIEQFLL